MALESTMITSVIEVYERRDMEIIYIPGSYLHTESDENMIMILKGRLAEMLMNIKPKLYWKYVVSEEGVNILYTSLQKDLFGLLCIELLFDIKK